MRIIKKHMPLAALLAVVAALAVGCQSAPGPDTPDNPPTQPTPDPDAPETPDDPDAPRPDDPDPDDPDAPDDPDNPPADPDPTDPEDPKDQPQDGQDPRIGVWEAQSGELFPFGDGDGPPTVLFALATDGTSEIIQRSPETGILHCLPGLYTFPSADAMILELGEPKLLRTSIDANGLLTVVDGQGNSGVFRRRDALPADGQCRELRLLETITDLPTPDFNGTAAFDGTSLWYTDDEKELVEVDPDIVQVYPEIGRANFLREKIHAAQGEQYWLSCHCAVGPLAVRRTQSGVVVDELSATQLGLPEEKFATLAIAVDADADVLWLLVNDVSLEDGDNAFLTVDIGAEPFALIDQKSFPDGFKSMVFDGTDLWGLTILGDRVVQLDIQTLKAKATFLAPDPDVEWEMITADRDRLMLIGEGDNRSGVLGFALPADAPRPEKPKVPAPFDPFGVWQLLDGFLLMDEGGRAPMVLVIGEDGEAQVVYQDEGSETLHCFDGTATVENGALGLHFDEILGIEDINVTAAIEMPEPHKLTLTDSGGGVSTLQRRRIVPDRFRCKTLEEVERFVLPDLPDVRTGLAYDGQLLWYSDSPFTAVAVDPESGAVAGSNGFTVERFVHAIEEGDFWTLATTPQPMVQRVNAEETVIAEFSPAPTLPRSLTYDPATDSVWFHGNRLGQSSRLQFVNTDATTDPAKVVAEVQFVANMQGIAMDGRRIWSVNPNGRDAIALILPNAGKTIASYRNPDPLMDWIGIAAFDRRVFLLGRDGITQTGVLLEVEPQP